MKLLSFLSALALTLALAAPLAAQVETKIIQVPTAELEKMQNENLYRLRMIGFQVEKPAGWEFVMKVDPAASKALTRLDDEAIDTAAHELGSRPLVVASKYPQPHASLNPTLQVAMRPADQFADASASQILSALLEPMRATFADLELVEPVTEAEVSGLPAARFVADYTVAASAGSFPTRLRMWVVPRGPVFFVVGMSGAQEGEDAAEAEFQSILDSLVIDS